MAFKRIGVASSSAERKPFLEEYLDGLPSKERKKLNNSFHQVNLISFGRKGVILATDLFSVFVWKKSELYDNLKEAADVWAMGERAKLLQIHISDVESSEYEVGVDDTQFCSWDTEKGGKKLSVFSDAGETESVAVNPLL